MKWTTRVYLVICILLFFAAGLTMYLKLDLTIAIMCVAMVIYFTNEINHIELKELIEKRVAAWNVNGDKE